MSGAHPSLEVDPPAGEMFLQPGIRFTGGVGSSAAPSRWIHTRSMRILSLCLIFQNGFRVVFKLQVTFCAHSLCQSIQAHLRRKAARLHRFVTASSSRLSPSGSVPLKFPTHLLMVLLGAMCSFRWPHPAAPGSCSCPLPAPPPPTPAARPAGASTAAAATCCR